MKNLLQYMIVIFCCLGIVQEQQAQDKETKEILTKVQQAYNKVASQQIEVTYAMHRGLTGNTITESYTGTMIKKGAVSQFKVFNSEIIKFPNFQLIIDHEVKEVRYTNNKNGGGEMHTPLDIKSFLKIYDKTQITTDNGNWICEMVSTQKNPQNPYGKVKLYIDPTTYFIKKQELFFTAMVPFIEEDGHTRTMDMARMVIQLDHKPLEEGITIPLPGDFIKTSATNTMILTANYKSYRLINSAH